MLSLCHLGIFLRSVLRSGKILLQKCAILRNAARVSLAMIISEKHAVQSGETIRNSLGLNYKSTALNRLSYAGFSHTKAVL
jgi:hypothetical protein